MKNFEDFHVINVLEIRDLNELAVYRDLIYLKNINPETPAV